MQVNVKRLNPDAILPTYGTDGAGCFDLYTTETGFVNVDEPCVFGTGLAFEIPKGYVMLIFSRSGHGFKYDVRLSNCVGVIDSDYRGELMVKLSCDDPDTSEANSSCYGFRKGERIAQGMIIPVAQNTFNVVEELSDTNRGNGGFGSTGN